MLFYRIVFLKYVSLLFPNLTMSLIWKIKKKSKSYKLAYSKADPTHQCSIYKVWDFILFKIFKNYSNL